MNAQILKPHQFARPGVDDPSVIAEPIAPPTYEELNLPEPQYGEDVLGELTDEEVELFLSHYVATQELQEIDREVNGSMIMRAGADYKSGLMHKENYEVEKNLDPEDAGRLFRAAAWAGKCKAELTFAIGEKYDVHDWSIGFRSKRRVVKAKRRW